MDAGSAGRKSSRLSRGSFGGAVLGIGISLIPLIVVLLVSDGMIEGITNRYMETKTYHLQITLPLEAGNDAQKFQTQSRKNFRISGFLKSAQVLRSR